MTTIDPHTSPIDEIRDWLAERAGLELHGPPSAHPFPPTLDGAASAMPEGWEWRRLSTFWNVGYGLWWEAFIWNEGVTIVRLRDTGDEIADRYRLAAACIIAEEKPNGS